MRVAAARGAENWWEPGAEETDEERLQREELVQRMAEAQGPLTTSVDVREFIDAKYAALREHVTQLSEKMFFLALTADDWRQLLPTEDFTLRVSRVGVRIPEDDLFAGVRSSAAGRAQ
jgi:LmbE family N-acetylglucosaminyl deacetylase